MTVLDRFRKARKTAEVAISSARSSLSEIRAEIASLHVQLSALDRRPVAFDDAVAHLDRNLREQAEIGQIALKRLAQDLAGKVDGYPAFNLRHIEGRETAIQIMVAGSAFRDALVAQMKATWGNDAGLTEDQREAERARLVSEIEALELVEEHVIREGAASGMPVQRRADQFPATVLAPDSALAEV